MSIRFSTILTLLVCLGFLAYLFTPFSWFVNIHSIQYSDMCVGDNSQLVNIDRTSRWDIKGEVENLLVLYTEEGFRIETNITRENVYTYESNIREVTYEIIWDRPVTRVGTYGVQSIETIYPFAFWPVREFLKAQNNLFEVIECYE